MKHKCHAHEFALYAAGLHERSLKKGQVVECVQPELVHRISRVLRLKEQDKLILFDRQVHIRGVIERFAKHAVFVRISTIADNISLKPHISLWLPLLKREAFEQAVYSAVELGANEIRLINTHKEQRHWREKELQRLQHIMIAAAEQSKYFALPRVYEPMPLLDVQPHDASIFFDPQGKPFFECIRELHQQRPVALSIFIGPEGDLTEAEKFYLQQKNVQFVRLTPTILRAQHAVTVGLGALRSLLIS